MAPNRQDREHELVKEQHCEGVDVGLLSFAKPVLALWDASITGNSKLAGGMNSSNKWNTDYFLKRASATRLGMMDFVKELKMPL